MKKKKIQLSKKLIFTKDIISDLNPGQQGVLVGGATGNTCIVTDCTATFSIQVSCPIGCFIRTRDIKCELSRRVPNAC